MERFLAGRAAMAIAIALSVAIALPSIAVGFHTDDHAFRAALHADGPRHRPAYDLFRFTGGEPRENELRVRFGALPWWSAPDLRLHFLRPLTGLVFAAEDTAFGDAPLGYHLVALGL